MGKRALLVTVFSLVCSSLLIVSAQVSTGLPDLPEDISVGRLLFPQAVQYGVIDKNAPLVLYIFLAQEGEMITVTTTRNEGEVVPYLELWRSREMTDEPMSSQAADDLAGRSAELSFSAPYYGWYYVSVKNDPASGEDFTGEFSIMLTNTTPLIYSILDYGEMPALDAHARVMLHSRTMVDVAPQTLYFPVDEGEMLDVPAAADLRLRLYDANDRLLASGDDVNGFVSTARQWLRLEVRRSGEEFELVSSLNGTEVAFQGRVLGDFLTLTPTATATATATPTATFTPTRTPTPLPTRTPTPTVDPNICNGLSPLNAIGDTVVVDFNQQGPNSALRLIQDLYASRSVSVGLAYDNNTLEILDGPVCFEGRWFWQVRLVTRGNIGWAVETDDTGDPFMCPITTPECRRYGGG